MLLVFPVSPMLLVISLTRIYLMMPQIRRRRSLMLLSQNNRISQSLSRKEKGRFFLFPGNIFWGAYTSKNRTGKTWIYCLISPENFALENYTRSKFPVPTSGYISKSTGHPWSSPACWIDSASVHRTILPRYPPSHQPHLPDVEAPSGRWLWLSYVPLY